MKTLATILAVALIPLLGFSQQTIHESIVHDGEERTYILYVPANYTGESAVPLVFNFHGYTSNAKQQMGYGDFRPIGPIRHGRLCPVACHVARISCHVEPS